jgi:hypothetical protein
VLVGMCGRVIILGIVHTYIIVENTLLIEKARNENLSLRLDTISTTEEGTKNKHFFISLNFHLPFVCGVMF